MIPPKSVAAAAAMFLAQVNAWPHLSPRQTDVPAPWVTVDASGVASTVTPSVSTVSGTATTIVNGAPADVTGTVRTVFSWDLTSVTTETASPAKPTGDVAGAFAVCKNKNGKDAPFCSPTAGSQLFPGSSYYFTWDAEYFIPNASVIVAAHYYNESTKEIGDEAFRSPTKAAIRGFWAYPIDASLIRSPVITTETIMLQIITDKDGLVSRQDGDIITNNVTINGPIMNITKQTGPVAEQHFNMPAGPELYIGLPVIGGFILLCVVGICLWNRKHRKVDLSNIMSRAGYGAGKSARTRLKMGKSRKFKEHIQLREREIMQANQLSPASAAPSPMFYRDESPPLQSPGRSKLAHNDEEDLGSLVGTPTEDRKLHFDGVKAAGEGVGEPGNVFRDEMRRQNTVRSAARNT